MQRRNGSRGLYNKIRGLRKDETLSDTEVPNLRYVARITSKGIRQYGQLRYRHPVTAKWASKGCGSVPVEAEVEALANALMDEVEAEGREGTIVVRPEDVAFTAIRQKALDLLTLVRSGVDPEGAGGPQGFTVAEAIEKHISAPRRTPLAPSTVKYYRTVAKLYLPPWLKVPLRRLDGPAVVQMWEKLHKKHGAVTATMAMRVLAASWRSARFHDSRLPSFPELPRGALQGNEPKKSAITASALPQWFKEAAKVKGQRPALWMLALMTGLRRADLVSIRREHVDLEAGTLHVPKPKGGTRRAYTIPLSEEALVLVDGQLMSHNSEWLWPSSESKSGHLEDPDALPADGFSVDWTMHDLRRSYASIAAAVLQNNFHIRALMNHKLKGVTGGYIAFEADDLRPSQQRITDRLRKLGLPRSTKRDVKGD
jgi:integrase